MSGFKTYGEAFAHAQKSANEFGVSYGIEKPVPPYNEWNVLMLPGTKFRRGHELRCQVVATEHVDRVARGYEADVGISTRIAGAA